MTENKPKRDLDERHVLPGDDPEAALEALLKVDPEDKPELTEDQVAEMVTAALTDPDIDGPPPQEPKRGAAE